MDLHFTADRPTDEERAAIDAVLGAAIAAHERVVEGGRAARAERHLLLPALHAVADRVGWISRGALNYVSQRLSVAPAEAYGVASFYAMFSLEPRPRTVLHVCDDIACKARGADAIIAQLSSRAEPSAPSGDDGEVEGRTWLRTPCLGLCERAPAALLTIAGSERHEQPIGDLTLEHAEQALSGARDFNFAPNALPQSGSPSLRLLRRIGHIDPSSIDEYRAAAGFAALQRAFELGPSGVVREVTASQLVGRGGAAFPTGRKWDAVSRESARPHYVICNADESEPGTFKDRVLMESDPYALIEAMIIAGFATASEHGYIYIRGEYPLAFERLQHAIAECRRDGILGRDILDRGVAFDIELRRGAGAYICGEETALFNSLEGYRGEPRNKPPFPVQRGLFGKPTVVNNVETLVNVLEIVVQGGDAYAAIGAKDSSGTKLFCVSGNIERPGLYEVPFGASLRELLELAGGVPKGHTLQAVLLGGAAGAFVTPDELDTPLTFDGVRSIRATLGSGVVLVFDESVDLERILLRMVAFFRDESCGQCVPCRVGTVRQEEALHRLAARTNGASSDRDRALVAEIGAVMRDASICGLGQTASSAIESALAKLPVFERAGA
jgi:NADH-quinone oxidoreductase subunit F